jgi:zinc finger CCHC domain-containing protein 9
MTRYTNFGRKRTYVDAGFGDHSAEDASASASTAAVAAPASPATPVPGQSSMDVDTPAAKPPKKKRVRTPKSKRDNYGKDKLPGAGEAATVPGQERGGGDNAGGAEAAASSDAPAKPAPSQKKLKRKLKFQKLQGTPCALSPAQCNIECKTLVQRSARRPRKPGGPSAWATGC